jgi:hypothetical protein
MVIDTIMVDFVIHNSTEFKFYQMETPIAIAPYFSKFYIDEDNTPIPVRSDNEFPLIPDTAIIILN